MLVVEYKVVSPQPEAIIVDGEKLLNELEA